MKNLFIVALVVSSFNVFAFENSDLNVDCAATAEDGRKVSSTEIESSQDVESAETIEQ